MYRIHNRPRYSTDVSFLPTADAQSRSAHLHLRDARVVVARLRALARLVHFGLHLLDPALELILVAELVPAFTLVQLQSMEISLVLS